MISLSELLKAILLGIVEGVTEWLPISSTGHMILVNELLQLDMSDAFKEMFFVVIQLGAILAVVLLYWKRLLPFSWHRGLRVERDTFVMWLKIAVACLPAAIIGILWDDQLNALFYNYQTVAASLIVFGVLFLWVESRNQGRRSRINSIAEITWQVALLIGVFQVIAAIFPGTSRSGATIVGALLFGVARTAAAEFTFFLAVPVMFGASALKLLQFGLAFTGTEVVILLTASAVAFLVSLLSIRLLMGYIKRHDFRVFGWYRIVLGAIVLLYFGANR